MPGMKIVGEVKTETISYQLTLEGLTWPPGADSHLWHPNVALVDFRRDESGAWVSAGDWSLGDGKTFVWGGGLAPYDPPQEILDWIDAKRRELNGEQS